jgi:hypothetical protein
MPSNPLRLQIYRQNKNIKNKGDASSKMLFGGFLKNEAYLDQSMIRILDDKICCFGSPKSSVFGSDRKMKAEIGRSL